MSRPSLYDFAGGRNAFLALAAAVTERCIEDPELGHAFGHGLSHNHNENLAAYWAEVFGGPQSYSANIGGHSGMLGIHAARGAPDEWGDRFEACFIAAMDDAQLPDDPNFRKAMRDYIHWATREVNRYSPQGSEVKPEQAMPRWTWEGLEKT